MPMTVPSPDRTRLFEYPFLPYPGLDGKVLGRGKQGRNQSSPLASAETREKASFFVAPQGCTWYYTSFQSALRHPGLCREDSSCCVKNRSIFAVSEPPKANSASKTWAATAFSAITR